MYFKISKRKWKNHEHCTIRRQTLFKTLIMGKNEYKKKIQITIVLIH